MYDKFELLIPRKSCGNILEMQWEILTSINAAWSQFSPGAYYLNDSNLEGTKALVGAQNSSGWVKHSTERIVESQTRIFDA